jgi:hypothetical protein
MIKKTKCSKCGYEAQDNLNKFGLDFCRVCFTFAPNQPEELDNYIQEKISSENLDPFRKYAKLKGQIQKKAMSEKASKGESMNRPPFGYVLEKGSLVPAKNFQEVEEIFEDFLNKNLSLRKLAENHSLSVNGLKKILTNFTYIGKIKFNKNIYNGNHEKIISSTLFNHVQKKLDKLGIKR